MPRWDRVSTTTLAMLLAEELEVGMSQIHHIETLHHPDFKHTTFREWTNSALNVQMTGGSVSIRAWHQPFRKIGATARELLRSAAAQKWNVPLDECRAVNGRIEHSGNRRSLGYGELAGAASRLTPPENPTLKTPEQFRLLGRAIPRWDTPEKVNGSAVFGTDVDLPGMLYGTVKHCVVFGERLTGVDDTKSQGGSGRDRHHPAGGSGGRGRRLHMGRHAGGQGTNSAHLRRPQGLE